MDPFGWSGNYNDGYSTDIGNLWATRIGIRDSSGNLNAKEPYYGSSWYGTIATGASDFKMSGYRIGWIASGSLWVMGGLLNASPVKVWDSSTGTVSKFAMAGNRIAVLLSNGDVWAKEGDLSHSSWGTTAQRTGASDVYVTGANEITPARIGVLVSGGLYVKEALGDNWYNSNTAIATSVATADMTRNRIAVAFTDGTSNTKEGSFGVSWSDTQETGVNDVRLGGDRFCVYKSASALVKCKEGPIWIGSTWVSVYNPTSMVRVNNGRIEVKDTSSGNSYSGYYRVLEGPINSGYSNSGWQNITNTSAQMELN